MSKTKISDLRREIAFLKNMIAEAQESIHTEMTKASSDRAHALHMEKLVGAKDETIAALRELVELYKLRCSVRTQSGGIFDRAHEPIEAGVEVCKS